MDAKTQSANREVPASLGPHGSRRCMQTRLDSQHVRQTALQPKTNFGSDSAAQGDTNSSPRDAANPAATEGSERHSHLLTIQEISNILHVPVSWVYGRLRKRALDRIPAYRLGKYWRFREAEVMEWISRQYTNDSTRARESE